MGKYIVETQKTVDSIKEYLEEFRIDIFPAYQAFGLTFSEALALFKQQCITNEIIDLSNKIASSDDEEWKNGI